MINREKRCSECLILQKEEMESPYVCEGCENKWKLSSEELPLLGDHNEQRDKMELPTKGKDVIALCSNGQERHLFRCACANEKCTEWRCAITGRGMIVEVTKWVYDEN